jgi:hypothetical protein
MFCIVLAAYLFSFLAYLPLPSSYQYVVIIICFYYLYLTRQVSCGQIIFTMTAYPSQTQTTLGQLCTALWDSQCGAAWIQTSSCNDASCTEIQCLRPPRHSGASCYNWMYPSPRHWITKHQRNELEWSRISMKNKYPRLTTLVTRANQEHNLSDTPNPLPGKWSNHQWQVIVTQSLEMTYSQRGSRAIDTPPFTEQSKGGHQQFRQTPNSKQ